MIITIIFFLKMNIMKLNYERTIEILFGEHNASFVLKN